MTCAGDVARATKTEEIPALMAALGYRRHADSWVNAVFVDSDRWAEAGGA